MTNRERADDGTSPYVPMREAARYYPGRIQPEREARVDAFEVDIEDLTVDDLFAHLSKAPYRYFYRLLKTVRDRFGETAMQDVARDFGDKGGRALFRAMERRFGPLGPEEMARYQDLAHYLMGRDMVDTEVEFTEDECVVRRYRCSFYDNAPAGMEKVCMIFDEAATNAYMDEQPGLVVTRPKKLPLGDGYCEHRFRFSAPEEPESDAG